MRARGPLLAAGLSLVLCLTGVQWGLPSRFHPDEKADVVASMLRERRLLPDSYVNPSLPLLVSMPVLALQQSTCARCSQPWSDPLLAARVLSAIVTALAVLVLGLAAAGAAPASPSFAPALGALLLAVAPGVVNLGHFATPEPFLLALGALVLLVAVRHVESRAPAWALGAALGLAASSKYTAAALAVPALAAIWLRRREPAGRSDRLSWLVAGGVIGGAGLALAAGAGAVLAARLHLPDVRLLHPESARRFVDGATLAALAAGGALVLAAALSSWGRSARFVSSLVRRELVVAFVCALGAFVLGTPGAVVDPSRFLSDLAFNAQTRHEYKGLIGETTSFFAYLGLAADALTLPVLAAAVCGLLLAGRRSLRGDRVSPVIALAALTPYVLVASSGHRAMRFLVPAWPAAAWLAALALSSVPTRRARRALAAAVVARSAFASLLVLRLFFVDSRLLAAEWLEQNVPRGATIDFITNHEGYAPRAPEGRNTRLMRTLSREMAPAPRFSEAAQAYPAEASGWLVMTASFYARFLEHPEQRPERARFFGDLLEGRAGFRVAARFRQQGWLRPRAEFLDPEIVILRRTGAGEPPSR